MCRTERPWSVRSDAAVWTVDKSEKTVDCGVDFVQETTWTQREEVVRNPECPDEYYADEVLMRSPSSSYRSL